MQEVNVASWNTCVFNLGEADVLIVWFAFQGGEPQKERKKEEIYQFRNCKSFLTILVKDTDQKRHNRLNSLQDTEIISERDLRHLATHNNGVGRKHCLLGPWFWRIESEALPGLCWFRPREAEGLCWPLYSEEFGAVNPAKAKLRTVFLSDS